MNSKDRLTLARRAGPLTIKEPIGIPFPPMVPKYPQPTWVHYGTDISIVPIQSNRCILCGAKPVPGEWLLVRNVVSNNKLVWYVMHDACIKKAIESLPPETFTAIKMRLEEGGDLFVDT